MGRRKEEAGEGVAERQPAVKREACNGTQLLHQTEQINDIDRSSRNLLRFSLCTELCLYELKPFRSVFYTQNSGVFITQGKFLIIRQHLESQLREMLKNFSAVACSEDCIVIEGPVLDCWTCLRMTTRCFRGDYCKDENPKKAENREIALYLILIAEAVILASAVLLFHFCISHRRKMKVIRRTLKTYLEKKLEELVEVVDIDDEQKDLETLKSKSQSQTRNPTSAESELQTGT
ncbi:hypothetical protein STEG23_002856 [Scotinomys teguina]